MITDTYRKTSAKKYTPIQLFTLQAAQWLTNWVEHHAERDAAREELRRQRLLARARRTAELQAERIAAEKRKEDAILKFLSGPRGL